MAEAVRAGGTVSSDILSHRQMAEAVRAEGTASSDILRAAHWLSRYVPKALSHRIYSRTAYWLRRHVPEARHFSDILSHSPLAEAVRAGGTSLFGNPVRDAGACRDRASPSRQRAGGTPLPTII